MRFGHVEHLVVRAHRTSQSVGQWCRTVYEVQLVQLDVDLATIALFAAERSDELAADVLEKDLWHFDVRERLADRIAAVRLQDAGRDR